MQTKTPAPDLRMFAVEWFAADFSESGTEITPAYLLDGVLLSMTRRDRIVITIKPAPTTPKPEA